MSEFKWFLIAFAVLYALWYLMGGFMAPDRNKPFLHQPAPIENGKAYSTDELKQENPSLFQ